MQLKVVVLLVVFAFVRAEEETCGEEKAGECVVKLLSSILEETTDEQDCATLAEASSCLEEAAKECTEETRNEEIEGGRQFLKILEATNCPPGELPDDVEECVNELEPELMACIDDGVAEILEQVLDLPEETEINEDEIKCGMYEAIARCVVAKIENKCGEEASLAALNEMMNDEEIKESCKKGTEGESALGGLMLDLAKKRRK
ncbi:uncharacterized protein LOC129961826 [Argiope bruennichi]|uniref:uncharacterized protein LOC129961826 n=1 Tax=Argiope bruennichi TaxID=94029 RepID=UPI002494DA9F|nr:uncharacterized protein LOC129961826 [Argiope bruennichi]